MALLPKSMIRDITRQAVELDAKKAGFNSAAERMADVMSKSRDDYWKGIQAAIKVEPKELNVSVENSAEALLAAIEAQERGEIVEFATAQITAVDAEFVEVPTKTTLWPRRVIASSI